MATGKVVIGDCGAPPDLNDYTMIGDSANLAARLESANKQFGTSILVDGRTAELSKGSGLAMLSLGRVVVVGQSVPIHLHEICLEDDPSARIAATESMVRLFAEGRYDECRQALREIEVSIPGSGKLVHAFLDAIDNPADLRDGVLRLRAK
jgi:class 3 adenylate cyclase